MTGGKAEGGAAGEGEVGIGSHKKRRPGEPRNEEGLFGALSTTKGDEAVRFAEKSPEVDSRFLVKAADVGAAEKRGAGEVDFFPKTARGRGGVQGRGGQFGNRTF